MNKAEELKALVREKYTEIAGQDKAQNETSCCGAGGCGVDYTVFAEDYSELEGYLESADLGLGCGIPIEHAGLATGQTVIDLGSGAGNDVFVARAIVGETGEVIGVDMTEKMIELAKANAKKLGFSNVKFRLGEIENMPISANRADVVISNCVLNLVPEKEKAFAEIYRVLKPGGHFCISDVVIKGDLPKEIREAGEMYAGCVSGAVQKGEYLSMIDEQGFACISVKKEKEVRIPDSILLNFLDEEGLKAFRESGTGIYSITVRAKKDGCGPDCC